MVASMTVTWRHVPVGGWGGSGEFIFNQVPLIITAIIIICLVCCDCWELIVDFFIICSQAVVEAKSHAIVYIYMFSIFLD